MSYHHEGALSLEHEKIKKLLLKGHVGYVLVTAKRSIDPESLEVELSYEGEPALASYLVEGAQGVLDEIVETEMEETGVCK